MRPTDQFNPAARGDLMSKKKTQTYLNLPEAIRRMAGMAAARAGKSLSEYISELIRSDADEMGIAKLVEQEEVQP